MSDLRHAFRLLAKSPAFTAVAVATLALAIGVNSAIFSLVNGLMLKPVVLERPEEVVGVFTARRDATRSYRQFSHAEYLALRESRELFADVTGINFALAGVGARPGEMRRSFVFIVAENFFSLHGARPAAGRFFTAEEARPNADLPVVVVSHALWQRAGGRPDFVGSTLYVNDRPHTVVGIAPEGFSGISALIAPEVWLPLGRFSHLAAAFGDGGEIRDLAHPRNYTLNVIARLQPGFTLEAARSGLAPLSARLNALLPPEGTAARELQLSPPVRFSIDTGPGSDGPVDLIATLLLAMAGVVLLIACLNLANMLLARGTARAREMAVRLAVGASRGRIVRQLLTEGLVLALLGGAAGVGLAFWANGLLERSFTALLGSMNFSLATRLEPDGTALAVTFLFCLLATLLSGLGPAIKAARTDVVTDLKDRGGDATAAGTGRWNRFFAPRHVLVMTQMTLSLVLLFAAGLFFRGALKAGNLELGFDPHGVALAEIDFSLTNTPQAEGLRRLDALVGRVRALPGVQAAGFSSLVPYANITNTTRLVAAHAPLPAAADPAAPRAGASGVYSAITPGYLDSIGARLLRGRDFTEVEARQPDAPRVCIIDEGMARTLFPDTDALGQRVRYAQERPDGSSSEMEVVGIVAPHRHAVDDRDGLRRRVYVPLAQNYSASVYLGVRYATRDEAAVLANLSALRAELRAVDPELPLLQLQPFTHLLERSVVLWFVRMGAVLFGVFGVLALLLAVVGVYGVKAYAVERRTREIGIRMALGAGRGDVFALIMRQGALQVAAAAAAGLILSLLAGQALAAILFQVSPTDPLVLAVSILVLAAAALLACWLPARRATRVDPMTALRAE